jgi:hypothetical protein
MHAGQAVRVTDPGRPRPPLRDPLSDQDPGAAVGSMWSYEMLRWASVVPRRSRAESRPTSDRIASMSSKRRPASARARRMRRPVLDCTVQTLREQVSAVIERYQWRISRLTAQASAVAHELAARASARLPPALGVAVSRHTALRVLLQIPLPRGNGAAGARVDGFALRRGLLHAQIPAGVQQVEAIEVRQSPQQVGGLAGGSSAIRRSRRSGSLPRPPTATPCCSGSRWRSSSGCNKPVPIAWPGGAVSSRVSCRSAPGHLAAASGGARTPRAGQPPLPRPLRRRSRRPAPGSAACRCQGHGRR